MNTSDRIKNAFERNVKALSLRSAIGRGTAVTRVRLEDGLSCEVEDGPWKLRVDMSEKHGGTGSAPNPGVLARGALGSCLVVGYMMWAARLEVPITSLEVEIQADYDARGEYGVAEVPVGYSEIRYRVTVKSPALKEDVLRVLDAADLHSSIRSVFARPVGLKREVNFLE